MSSMKCHANVDHESAPMRTFLEQAVLVEVVIWAGKRQGYDSSLLLVPREVNIDAGIKVIMHLVRHIRGQLEYSSRV